MGKAGAHSLQEDLLRSKMLSNDWCRRAYTSYSHMTLSFIITNLVVETPMSGSSIRYSYSKCSLKIGRHRRARRSPPRA